MTIKVPGDGTWLSGLAPITRTAWAKHDRDSGEWMPLWRHMADAGAIAGLLWREWVPRSLRRLVADELPGDESDSAVLVGFLGASHDIGKLSPAFASQVDPLADRMRAAGFAMPTRAQLGDEHRMAPHGLAGQLLLQEWMADRYGLGARTAGQFAVIAGGHHGQPPEHQQILDAQMRPHLLRDQGSTGDTWRASQFELMDFCARITGADERLAGWAAVRLSQPAQVVLTAVVIVADWVASSPELFPYDPSSWQPLGLLGEKRRIGAAWAGLDLPPPWTPSIPDEKPAALFASRFPAFAGRPIRAVQAEAVRLAHEMPEPGMLIVEAPMGEGKTEAALMAAEILASRSGAGGLLFALPTRATSDAMFTRLRAWLDALPTDGSTVRSLALAHAKAALNDEWGSILKQGSRLLAAIDPTASAEGERRTQGPAEFQAHQWLRGRKKQLLASFAVGTVDQVLFAGLKSRHLALRHLAVAGKVVIIDEVHAYDAYMNCYLDRVLHWLSGYRVPVILLSATLPAARRAELIAAYGGSPMPVTASPEVASAPYPILSGVSPGHPPLLSFPEAAPERGLGVSVERLEDDFTVLAELLKAELAGGGCALVVRNTVGRVLDTAAVLREHLGPENVTVTHSRFLASDRAVNDSDLLRRFGPPPSDRSPSPRPSLHVVVASQVVEQSLDVDFDLLVTDAAPVDLVLQRIGRLHRHTRRRPARLRRPRCLITGPAWHEDPPTQEKGAEAVYHRHPLLRSLAVLGPHFDGRPLFLPEDIGRLVQQAYDDGLSAGPDSWSSAMAEAAADHAKKVERQRHKATAHLLGAMRRPGRPVYGWLAADVGDVEDNRIGRAQVRDGEESLEVLVVQQDSDGTLRTVPWLDLERDGHTPTRRSPRGGRVLPTDFPPPVHLAKAVTACALTLPRGLTHPGVIDHTIALLEGFMLPAWQAKECPWLEGQLILPLTPDGHAWIGTHELAYDRADGLRLGPADTRPTATRSPASTTSPEALDRESTPPVPDLARTTSADAGGAPATDHPVLASDDPFNLLEQPWIPVRRGDDGRVEEVSLLGFFAAPGTWRRLVGDLPTQEPALLRLLLAIVHDALDGPEDADDWEDLWNSPDPFAGVPDYLREHRDRFALFHPEHPFFQVAGLRTGKNEVASLNRLVADVPAGAPFFSMRRPGAVSLGLAEAARWLVHVHAFDTSGIKPAMDGDSGRARAGKVYPLGVGTLGNLGVLFAEGADLRETLLLNLIPFDTTERSLGPEDLPVWRRVPLGPGPRLPEQGGEYPRGPRDLYTWQSRRVRLHRGEDGSVTGVVVGYGDPPVSETPWTLEPMSGWRRSEVQEKKRGRVPYYTPRRHDPQRSAWRGLEALLPARAPDGAERGEPPLRLASGVTRWFAQVATETEIPPTTLVRMRVVGVAYGTQQSVIDEVVDDQVVLPVVTLHTEDRRYGAAAVDAVHDAEDAVKALGQLAANLARAAGVEPEPRSEAVRDRAFGALDGPYRHWLAHLLDFTDIEAARQDWRTTLGRVVRSHAGDLLADTPYAAHEGRMAQVPGRSTAQWLDAGRAELWFRARLRTVLKIDGAAAVSEPGPLER
ncbi:type I-E CRISPR-associated protein Cse1/CasA [Streptomyces sp. BI20]|uniref:type I-E CRISPR-associated protein Cse1/CasA n=1 Tax=Streptomyces sp. BI20 TaxID=3403460 RepID=UPI003C71EFE3